jgi:hypothetical protein
LTSERFRTQQLVRLFLVQSAFLTDIAPTPASAKCNDFYFQLGSSYLLLGAFADVTNCNLDSDLAEISNSFCGYFTLAPIIFATFCGWPRDCLSLAIALTVITCTLLTYYVHVNGRIKLECAISKIQDIMKSHKPQKDPVKSTYSSMPKRAALIFFSWETFSFLGILILYCFGIQDSHHRIMMRLEFVLLCSALVCGVYALTLAYIQHLWDKLERAKVSLKTLQNSVLSINLVHVSLFCSSAIQTIFVAILGGFSGFYLDLLLDLTMLIMVLLIYRVHVDCIVEEERMIQKTQEAERQTKMDQKARKIATLETTIEGLHHQLYVLRQHREKETEALDEFQAEAARQHKIVVQEYAAAFNKTNTVCADQQKEIEALEAVLTETRKRHVEAMGKLHLDQAQALDKVKADTISGSRLAIRAELQQLFQVLPDMPIEYYAQYFAAKTKAHECAMARKDAENAQLRAEKEGLADVYENDLKRRDREHAQVVKKKDEEHAQALKKKDEEHALALENDEEYVQVLRGRDEEHDRILQNQKKNSEANFAERLRLELWIQEQYFSYEKRQAEAAADEVVQKRRGAHLKDLAAAAGQCQQALAQNKQFYEQRISKERQGFHMQFEIVAVRHRDELQQKEMDLNMTINEKSQEIQDLIQVVKEKDGQIDALEYEKLCHTMNWEVVLQEKESWEKEGKDGASAGAEEDPVVIGYEHNEYEADDENSEFESIDSLLELNEYPHQGYEAGDEDSHSGSVDPLPELAYSDDEGSTEGSAPPKSATDDEEWDGDDVEIKVDGDDDDDNPRGWSLLDSDDEYALY